LATVSLSRRCWSWRITFSCACTAQAGSGTNSQSHAAFVHESDCKQASRTPSASFIAAQHMACRSTCRVVVLVLATCSPHTCKFAALAALASKTLSSFLFSLAICSSLCKICNTSP
jgi:hypothetical protein